MTSTSQVWFLIRRLHLRHFRVFAEADVVFHPRLNVIISTNGAGKTSLLEATARLLQVYVHTVAERSTAGIAWGQLFTGSDLAHGAKGGLVGLEAEVGFRARAYAEHEEGDENPGYDEEAVAQRVHWQVALRPAHGGWMEEGADNDWSAIERLALELRRRMEGQEAVALPIVVFFPSNIALGPVGEAPEREAFQQVGPLDSLADALGLAALDYQAFFRWFRWLHSKRRSGREEQVFAQVRRAVCDVLNGPGGEGVYDHLHVDWEQSVSGELAIEKQGLRLKISQLSEGEKRLVLMAAHLAYRLAVANPDSDQPLMEGTGVVLIDEVDLHLHPQWESRVVPNLAATFPSLQFIITSHSAAVLQSVGREHLIVLDNGQVRDPDLNPFTLGRQIDEINQDAFGLPMYPEYTPALEALQAQVRRCYDLLDDGQAAEAEALLAEIRAQRGPNDSDVATLENLLELAKME